VIAGRARFRHARKIERAVGYRIPDLAFHGATLDALSSRINPERLDNVLREQVLSFFNSFLKCDCRDSPQCGCPEKKFAREIIEFRENGLDHRQISFYLQEEYGIDIYPADILSFLEESVHVLEAIRDIAALKNKPELKKASIAHIEMIERF
jgi:superfamily II helicase